ncbi:MAG TPA: queuosine precursor transporter [Isosphaeraceae bacterium]|jgi:hypothetical protein|nr:queuosine precursor transporter [Isosphaeraceae bacterium]
MMEPATAAIDTSERANPPREYRYYDLIMAAFVTILICSNFISAPKRVTVAGFTFGAGVLFFPISYLFGDLLTEVYGYARSRKVVWAGFGALAFASFMSWVVLALPPAPTWGNQAAWETVFAGTPRVVVASMLGFFAGEFTNSFTLAKLKILTGGRRLWVRTIGSTITGEAVDSILFYPIAFLGRPGWSSADVLQILVANYTLKVGWEVLATPFTYKIVGFLKRAENEDYYDYGTDFTPFSLKT